jgi:cellulose biosynthesis protein BcsQ
VNKKNEMGKVLSISNHKGGVGKTTLLLILSGFKYVRQKSIVD